MQPDVLHGGNARFKLLSDIAGELLLSEKPHEILRHVFERLSAHLGLEIYFNYLVEEGYQRLRLNSFGGISAAEAAPIEYVGFGQAVCGMAAADGRRLVVEDMRDLAGPQGALMRRLGITAYACHPLIAHGRLLGTLSFGTGSRAGFTDDELELLQTVSNQIAVALERARMTAELERRAAEQSRAMKRAEASLAQLEAVVGSMSEGVVITTLHGEPVLVNPAALDLLGFETLEQCRGHFGACHRLYEARYANAAPVPWQEWPVQRIARGESFSEVEALVVRRDTGGSWIGSFSGRPVRTLSGEIVLAAVTIRDITARTINERALKEAKEAAESANRAKDHFLATLSHELRTPLTPVLTLVQALESEMGVPEQFIPYLEIIRRNVELEVLLIDDLLDLTRIARGKLQFILADTDLHAILRHVLEIYRGEIAEKNLAIRFDPAATDAVVHGDTTRLQQVFWNLLKNAVKFTAPGGAITVSTCNVDSGWVRVEVADTGIGIERDLLPKIFDAFEQGRESTSARFGGLGLGLAISKAVIDRHGGSISAGSEGPGRGATFQVTLATAQGRSPVSADAAAERPCAGNGNALVVLPEGEQAAVVRELLEAEGYRVQAAAGVRAAMQMASSSLFDLLFCGVVLPDGYGSDLIRNLNAIRRIKGVLLAGDEREEMIERSLGAGYSACLRLPAGPDQLRATLHRVLAG